MQLEDLSPDHLRQALGLYCHHAFPGDDVCPRVDLGFLETATDTGGILAHFERGDPGDDASSRRYSLRLGNHRYPFMKFVFQEHLVAGEFFFSVDTHDKLDVPTDSPEYADWEELKRANRDLAASIESDWRQAGLPTHAELRDLLEGVAEREREAPKKRHLLVVDDDRLVCNGLCALLRARGYGVEEVHDGFEALERLREGPLPDLVLLDYEMPVFDGQAVLDRMRESPRLSDLPVLLATAARIDLSALQRVSGFLHKPYPRSVLFEMLERIVPSEGGGAPPGPDPDSEG